MLSKNLLHFIFYLNLTLQRALLLPYGYILNTNFYFKLLIFIYLKKKNFFKKSLTFLTLNLFLQSLCLQKINFFYYYMYTKLTFLLALFNYNLYFFNTDALNTTKLKTTLISLIRSPHVYKVSFEQLGETTFIYNFFFKKIRFTLLSHYFFKQLLYKFNLQRYALFKCRILLS